MQHVIMERVQDLIRRLHLLIETGVVEEINDQGLVRVRLDEDRITPFIHTLLPRAFEDIAWHPLDQGEQVMLLCPSGELSRALVMGSLKPESQASPSSDFNSRAFQFNDGALFEYNREQHHLKIHLPSGATTELVADGGIKVVGDTHIEGTLTVDDATHLKDSLRVDQATELKDSLTVDQATHLKDRLTVNSMTELKSLLKVAGPQANDSTITSQGDQIAGGVSQILHIHAVGNPFTTPPR